MRNTFARITHEVSLEGSATRYAVAVLFTAIALALNSFPPARSLPFVFFFGAVALSARFCGSRPALLTMTLSALVADYFFLGPFGWSANPPDLWRLLFFVLVSLVIASVARQKSEAQRSADEQRSKMAELLDSISEGFVSLDADWNITFVNERGATQAGRTVEQLLGRNHWLEFPDTVGTPVEENYRRAMREQTIQRFEYYYPAVDRWFLLTAYPSPERLTVLFQDITERKRSEEALQRTERRLQFAQIAAGLGSWEWDVKSGELWWSDGIWLLHGHKVGDVAATFENWISFVQPEDRPKVQEAVAGSLRGEGSYEVEYRTEWPDGSLHWVIARGEVIFDEKQEPLRMTGIGMDITERRLAAEALRKSEKLAAAGRLAATVAHEINNPLEAITNTLYLLQRNPSLDEKARRHLAMAEQETARLAHIARQSLGFYRDTTSPVPVKLAEVLDEVLFVYHRRLSAKSISVRRELDSTATVVGLAGEIRQVLSNLVLNALDAMPQHGRLALRVRRGREWGGGGRPGVRVLVGDTGCGISPENRARVFEPFFTTKADVGTGLGLWISEEIIRKHGGKIRVRSHQGPGPSGTVFSIFLPEAPAKADAAESHASEVTH